MIEEERSKKSRRTELMSSYNDNETCKTVVPEWGDKIPKRFDFDDYELLVEM